MRTVTKPYAILHNPLSLKVAEREGFEPSVEFPLHMISSHARSTTPASLR